MRFVAAVIVVLFGVPPAASEPRGALSFPIAGQEVDFFEADIIGLPVVERLFVLKSAENDLGNRFRRVLADPVNAEDGYLWARKLFARCYARMALVAAATETPDLARFYTDRADLWSAFVRGEVDGTEFAKRESQIEGDQLKFLDSALASNPPKGKPDTAALKELALNLSKKVYGFSVAQSD